MAIGLLIIGDEILSGKRTDRHFSRTMELLHARGLQLDWVHYLGDDPARITDFLRGSFAGDDIVFSCGGIGATPDDHTRRCAADALGVPLVLHPFAKERILERIEKLVREEGLSDDPESLEYRNRMRMGEYPLGANVIPNPVNGIPGFSVGTHYFVPGFPEMAAPMIAWALDTHHAGLFNQSPQWHKSVHVYGVRESELTPLMEEIERDFQEVKTFSLPSTKTEFSRALVELGVKGKRAQVNAAFERVLAWLGGRSAEYKLVE